MTKRIKRLLILAGVLIAVGFIALMAGLLTELSEAGQPNATGLSRQGISEMMMVLGGGVASAGAFVALMAALAYLIQVVRGDS